MSTYQLEFDRVVAWPEADTWRIEHDAAMRVIELEEFVQAGLGRLQLTRESEARLYESVPPKKHQDLDLRFAQWYRSWHKTAIVVVTEAERFEERGYRVERLEALKDAVAEVTPYAEIGLIGNSTVELSNADIAEKAAANPAPQWWLAGEGA